MNRKDSMIQVLKGRTCDLCASRWPEHAESHCRFRESPPKYDTCKYYSKGWGTEKELLDGLVPLVGMKNNESARIFAHKEIMRIIEKHGS